MCDSQYLGKIVNLRMKDIVKVILKGRSVNFKNYILPTCRSDEIYSWTHFECS